MRKFRIKYREIDDWDPEIGGNVYDHFIIIEAIDEKEAANKWAKPFKNNENYYEEREFRFWNGGVTTHIMEIREID